MLGVGIGRGQREKLCLSPSKGDQVNMYIAKAYLCVKGTHRDPSASASGVLGLEA